MGNPLATHERLWVGGWRRPWHGQGHQQLSTSKASLWWQQEHSCHYGLKFRHERWKIKELIKKNPLQPFLSLCRTNRGKAELPCRMAQANGISQGWNRAPVRRELVSLCYTRPLTTAIFFIKCWLYMELKRLSLHFPKVCWESWINRGIHDLSSAKMCFGRHFSVLHGYKDLTKSCRLCAVVPSACFQGVASATGEENRACGAL